MSVGGIFKLITNDGKQDRMLMATALLNRRLMDIEKMRSRNPAIKDPTPTLVDIERTHVLFMNAHFKPFAAIGYEYNIVRSDGKVSTNSTVRFSIPQFGDFFNDMGLHVVLPPITGSFTSEFVTFILDFGIRYCDYPGVRLIQQCSFTVNGNPLDSYTSLSANIFQKFYVREDMRSAWNTCIGQINYNPFLTTTTVNNVGQVIYVGSGPQIPVTTSTAQNIGGLFTWTPRTAPLEMIIPLQFWFNLDPRLAIPSVAIPYGQRFIDIKIASINQLVVPTIDGNGVNFVVGRDTADILGAYSFNGTPVNSKPKNCFAEVNLTTCELYINNIFVNPEIHDIYIRRIGFSLIRVHLEQQLAAQNADHILLHQLKWPIETLYVAIQIDSQRDDPQFWHLYEKVDVTSKAIESTIPAVQLNSVMTAQIISLPDPIPQVVTYGAPQPIFSGLGVEAHGIKLYQNFKSQFYNGYVPFTYSGHNLTTTRDRGVLMINFNMYPGVYQPSGHINASRAREFYLNYTVDTAVVDFTSSPGVLYVAAVAINFLLVSDGSAILRYST